MGGGAKIAKVLLMVGDTRKLFFLEKVEVIMKKYIIGLMVAFVFLISMSGTANAVTWSQMTQLQKTTTVINTAYTYVKTPSIWGGQCYQWIQTVVKNASSGAVPALPGTINNDTAWAVSPNFAKKVNQDYTKLSYGDIVQMQYHNLTNTGIRPHTMIAVGGVCGIDGSMGFMWLDSNYSGDEKVQTHYISNNTFYQSIAKWTNQGGGYTIYNVK